MKQLVSQILLILGVLGCEDKFDVLTTNVTLLDCINLETKEIFRVAGLNCPADSEPADDYYAKPARILIEEQLGGLITDSDLPLVEPTTKSRNPQYAIVFSSDSCSEASDYATEVPQLSDLKDLPSGEYKVCIRAERTGSATGAIDKHASLVFNIDKTPPTAPTELAFSESLTNSQRATLSFNPSTDANKNEIRLCRNPDCMSECTAMEEVSAHSVDFSNLEEGSYYGCGRSYDIHGNVSEWINSAGTLEIDTTPPPGVADIALTSGADGRMVAHFNHVQVTDSNEFAVKVCQDSGCVRNCGQPLLAEKSPVTIQDFPEAGVGYFACVMSIDMAENTSSWVGMDTPFYSDATAPTGSISLAGGATYNTSVTSSIALTADAEVKQYQLCSSPQSEGTACTGSQLVRAWEDFTENPADHTFSGDGSFNLYVQFRDQAGNISKTYFDTIIIDSTDPTVPSSISIIEASPHDSDSINFSFTDGADTNFSTHNIKACTDTGCSAACVSTGVAASSSGSLTGLQDGVSYYACVQALDLAGKTSPFVASATPITIDTTSPTIPSNVSISTSSPTTGTLLSFSYTAGADTNYSTHNIKACTNTACDENCVSSTDEAGTSATVGSLIPLRTYYGCVRSRDSADNVSLWIASSNSLEVKYAAPPNPTGPSLAVDSDTAITFSWSSGGGTTAGYRISYRSGATPPVDCASNSQIGEGSISGTSYQITGLDHETQYSFRVCAINDNATPDVSSGVTATATTQSQPTPPDPTGEGAVVDSSDQITLSWTSGGGSTADYRIAYQTGASAPADCASGTQVGEGSITGTSHAVSGLIAGQQYSFRICAINANGTPGVSAGVNLTATTAAQAGPPNPVSPTSVADSDTAITVSWSSGGGSTADYRMAYKAGGTAPVDCTSDTQIGAGSISGTSHQVTGLTNETQYSFRICAINDNATPDVSSGVTATATTQSQPTPPDPTGQGAVVNSSDQITLSWTSGGGSTADYRIAYQTGASAPANCASGTQVGEGSITGTSHSLAGFLGNQQYSFRICAINANGTPDASAGVTVTATTSTEVAPPDPTSPGAAADSDSAITVSWSSGGGTTADYRMAYKAGGTPPVDCASDTQISAGSISGTSHQVTGLTHETQYSFRVCAINDNATPDVSSGVTATATTQSQPTPPDPTGQGAVVNSSDQITLSWTSGGGSTADYRIAYQTGATAPADCASGSQIGEGSITGTSHAVSGLVGNQQYSFRICAINANASPNSSSGVSIDATTDTEATPPDPTSPGAVADSTTAITLNWTSGGGTTIDYRISYQTGATAPVDCTSGTQISAAAISGTSHQITGLNPGQQYSFRICSLNNNSTPDISGGAEISGTTSSLAAPPDPTGLGYSEDSATELTLSWTGNGGTTSGYRIAYQTGNTAPADCTSATSIPSTSISGTSHQISGLTSPTEYSFRVCAINGNATPDESSGISINLIFGGVLDQGVKMDSGLDHYCSLSGSGRVYCAGIDTNGQLGNGASSGNSTTPQAIDSTETFVDMATGDNHSCALSDVGVVYCWGKGSAGQIGDGNNSDRQSPTAISSSTLFHSITAGGNHTCGISEFGALYCWGNNLDGQLGDSTKNASNTPVAVSTSSTFITISAGARHTCALRQDGKIYCWGQDYNAQVGDGNSTNMDRTTPTATNAAGLYFVHLSSKGDLNCAVTSEGDGYCWGMNDYGQAGSGSVIGKKTSPTLVTGSHKYRKIFAGYRNACGILGTGETYCWGEDLQGQLGNANGYEAATTTPTLVAGGHYFTNIRPGQTRVVAIAVDGTSHEWGDSTSTEPQTLDTSNYTTLVAPAFVDVSSASSSSCALTTAGKAYCWGANNSGQLGVGDTAYRKLPTPVAGGHRFISIVNGKGGGCGINPAGAAYCWGSDLYGDIGNGATSSNQLSPVLVDGNHVFKQIDRGWGPTCGITVLGTAYCWGSDSNGALGNGATTGTQESPDLVAGGHFFREIATGANATCGISESGETLCWGYWVAIGDGSNPTSPYDTSSGLNFRSFSANYWSFCGTTSNNQIDCWGDNFQGMLGNGTAGDDEVATLNDPLTMGTYGIQSVSNGLGRHTCASNTIGKVYCWGDDADYQLGDDAISADQYSPVIVSSSLNFRTIGNSSDATCGLTSIGKIHCWGSNTYGDLGLDLPYSTERYAPNESVVTTLVTE